MTIGSIFERYGRDVTLNGPDNWSSETYGAFIQPLRYKNKMYLNL